MKFIKSNKNSADRIKNKLNSNRQIKRTNQLKSSNRRKVMRLTASILNNNKINPKENTKMYLIIKYK